MTFFGIALALACADQPVTLAQAVERARDSSAFAMSASERVKEDELNRREIFAHLLPKVELSATQISQSMNMATFGITLPGFDPYVPFFSLQDMRLSASAPLYNAPLWSRLRETESSHAARVLDRETARSLAGLQGGLAWLEAAKADALVKDRDEGLRLAQALLAMTQEQKDAGSATRLDLVRSQIQVTQSQGALSKARQAYEKSTLGLGRILATPAGQKTSIIGSLAMQPATTIPAASTDETPAIKAARAGRQAAQQGIKTAESEKLPTIAAFADYGYIGTHLNRDGLWTGKVGVQASWDVFEGGAREAHLGKALVRERLAAIAERDSRLAARQDEDEALVAVTETVEQLKQAISASALADTELVLAQEKFKAGASGNSEVVQAQAGRTQAHAAWIEAAGAHQAAILKLRWARGNWDGVGKETP